MSKQPSKEAMRLYQRARRDKVRAMQPVPSPAMLPVDNLPCPGAATSSPSAQNHHAQDAHIQQDNRQAAVNVQSCPMCAALQTEVDRLTALALDTQQQHNAAIAALQSRLAAAEAKDNRQQTAKDEVAALHQRVIAAKNDRIRSYSTGHTIGRV